MARASTCTKLSLDRWAEIMGISGPAFNGVSYANCLYPVCNNCPEYWMQHSWQYVKNRVSRERLAHVIQSVERDLESFLGVPLCPKEVCETYRYDKNRITSTLPVDLSYPIMDAPNNIWTIYDRKGIGGRFYELTQCPGWIWGRQVSEEVAYTLTYTTSQVMCAGVSKDYYSDVDVEIVLGDVMDPVVAQSCEFKVYSGTDCSDCTLEIRPPYRTTVDVDEEAGTTTVHLFFRPWQFVDPDVWDNPPTYDDPANMCTVCPVDGFDLDNFLDEICVVRTYFDPSAATAEFCWDPNQTRCSCGSDACPACTSTCVEGCAFQGPHGLQFATVTPATYADGAWSVSTLADQCLAQPDYVRIYYWHGFAQTDDCDAPEECTVLCPEIEEIVAYMATARLGGQLCGCGCDTAAWWETLQRDILESNESVSYFVTQNLAESPFGTRKGELDAFRSATLIKGRLCGQTALI